MGGVGCLLSIKAAATAAHPQQCWSDVSTQAARWPAHRAAPPPSRPNRSAQPTHPAQLGAPATMGSGCRRRAAAHSTRALRPRGSSHRMRKDTDRGSRSTATAGEGYMSYMSGRTQQGPLPPASWASPEPTAALHCSIQETTAHLLAAPDALPAPHRGTPGPARHSAGSSRRCSGDKAVAHSWRCCRHPPYGPVPHGCECGAAGAWASVPPPAPPPAPSLPASLLPPSRASSLGQGRAEGRPAGC